MSKLRLSAGWRASSGGRERHRRTPASHAARPPPRPRRPSAPCARAAEAPARRSATSSRAATPEPLSLMPGPACDRVEVGAEHDDVGAATGPLHDEVHARGHHAVEGLASHLIPGIGKPLGNVVDRCVEPSGPGRAVASIRIGDPLELLEVRTNARDLDGAAQVRGHQPRRLIRCLARRGGGIRRRPCGQSGRLCGPAGCRGRGRCTAGDDQHREEA